MATTAAALAGLQQLTISADPPKVVPTRDAQTKEAGFTFVTHRVRTALNNSAGDCQLNYAIDYVEGCKPVLDKNTKTLTEAKPIADPAVKKLIEEANARYQAWLKNTHATEDKANYEKEMKRWNEAKNVDGSIPVEESKIVKSRKPGVERVVVFKTVTKKNKKGVVHSVIFRRPNFAENPLKTDSYYDYALRILKRERVRFSKDSYYAVTIFVDMLVRQVLEATFEVVKSQGQNNLTIEHFLGACATHGEKLIPLLPLFSGFKIFRNPASVPDDGPKHHFEYCTRGVWDDIKFMKAEGKKYTISSKFVSFVNILVDEFITRFGTAIRRSLFEGTKEIQHRLVDKSMILRALGFILNYEGISEEQVFNHINDCIKRYAGESEEQDETGQVVSPKVLGFLGLKSEHRKAMRDAKKANAPATVVPVQAPAPTPATVPVGLPTMPILPKV